MFRNELTIRKATALHIKAITIDTIKIPINASTALGGEPEIPPANIEVPNIHNAAINSAVPAAKANPAPLRANHGFSDDIRGYNLRSPKTLAVNPIIPGIAAHKIDSLKSEETLIQRNMTFANIKIPAVKNNIASH